MHCIAIASTEVTTLNPTNRRSETVITVLATIAIGAWLAIIIGAWFADQSILDFLLGV
jgi:hypothetical protein